MDLGGSVMLQAARTLLLGHFGSGKTEVAISISLSLCAEQKRPMLLDLDFITPYYRSRDVAEELAAAGVEVVRPAGELWRSDLPVVAARAVQAMTAYDGPVVADIGGGEGARVVGSMRLPPGTYEALMVINPYRPDTRSPEEVVRYARWLEEIGRIRLTGLVNNANLGPLTRPEHVVEGLAQVEEAARLLGLPVRFTAVRADLAGALPDLQVLPLQLRMRPPWEAAPSAVT